jgi:replication initiation and membrane attachment protein
MIRLNVLQLNEHARFVVVRRFGLSTLDHKMLSAFYQPIVGAFASNLYTTLCSMLPAEMAGASKTFNLSSLFLTCGLAPNEQGRQMLIEHSSRLEAVGLLRTFRALGGEELYYFEFRLEPPLLPSQLFDVHPLWYLFTETVGASSAQSLRRAIVSATTTLTEEPLEEISAPFNEVFRTSKATSAHAVRKETLASTATEMTSQHAVLDGFSSEELLHRFPRSALNRRFLERLLIDPARLAELNFWASRYELTLKETVSLLDDQEMFLPGGIFHLQHFKSRATEMTLIRLQRGESTARIHTKSSNPHAPDKITEQEDKDSVDAIQERQVDESHWLIVPQTFQHEFDRRQYNAMLVNASYDQVLKMHFRPSAVPPRVKEAFLRMHVDYQLPDEVINVMIHYLRTNNLDWSPKYLDAIATNAAGKHIRSFEQAVDHFHKAAQVRQIHQTGKMESKTPDGVRGTPSRRGKASAPKLLPPPSAPRQRKQQATEEDMQRILEKARKLKEQ